MVKNLLLQLLMNLLCSCGPTFVTNCPGLANSLHILDKCWVVKHGAMVRSIVSVMSCVRRDAPAILPVKFSHQCLYCEACRGVSVIQALSDYQIYVLGQSLHAEKLLRGFWR
eukprot:1703442-Pleurochrysis_carterae.AAC.1